MGSKRFSERHKYIKPPEAIQLEQVSTVLRKRLWNSLRDGPLIYKNTYVQKTDYRFERIIDQILKQSVDDWSDATLSSKLNYLKDVIESEQTPWYVVFDIVENAAQQYNQSYFFVRLNSLFEEEGSGYRFIGEQIEPISDQSEIAEITTAFEHTDELNLSGARTHLETALKLLAMRPEPDYRNAIKEAISMLESFIVTVGGKGGFSPTLNQLNEQLEIHPALIKGIENLYGFTSNEDGIRHAILDEKDIGYDEAKFMVVSCSALFNFLVSKSLAKGIISSN